MENIDLAKLSASAATVANASADREAAINDERAVEVAVFAAVIEAIRPALRALASRIVERHATTGGRNGCNPQSEKTYFGDRGLCLISGEERNRDESGNRGTYDGKSLYLLSDGRLAVIEHSGHWSHWQGEWDTNENTLRVVGAEEAMRTWDLGACVEAISAVLDKQAAGNTAKITAASKARAEKLRSLATLVK